MIASASRGIAILAMTKTGTTALEEALAPHCDIVITGPPPLKHMPLRRFDRRIRPLLEKENRRIETACLFREPIDWLGSWYRYRARDTIPDRSKSTAGMSFEAFVEAYLQDEPPAYARVGRPARFVSRHDGRPGIDHLYRYEAFGAFCQVLQDRFRVRIMTERRNVSPAGALSLSAALRSRAERFLAAEYEIYEGLAAH
ncbi:MAG: gamma-glutamyl kinase [Rubricella sp.]